MAGSSAAEQFRFLFRQDRGTIDAATWRPAAALLAATFVGATIVEWLANRFGRAISIGVTAIFVIGTMLVGASYYFLSAKRFRDRGRSAMLALILPAALFLVAALNFLQPTTGGYYPVWFAWLGDLALAGVVVWNVVELGFLARNGKGPAA